MNRDTLHGDFNQLKGKSKQKWGQLTHHEIDEMEGNAQILSRNLQARYGLERNEAERQATEFRREN